MGQKPQLLLIDGSSYIFRAFYGVKAELTNKEGESTNATFGFKNMLYSLLKEMNPSHCIVVFDPKGPTFRNEIYEEYKANRSEAPPELKPQFAQIHRLVKAMNLPLMVKDGYEADDLIGSLTKRFQGEIQVTIISGDKDLTQLVTEDVHMVDTMRKKRYTPETVLEKFGVKPEMIVEYLALVGDTSDNIPGAKGVGPKTAVKWFNEFRNIEGIYKNLKFIKGKAKEKLEDSKENVELSLKLTQIDCDIVLDCQLDDFLMVRPDLESLRTFYQDMGFKPDPLLKTLDDLSKTDDMAVQGTTGGLDRSRYEMVTEEARLEEIREAILAKKEFAIDFETTSLQTVVAKIVGISLAWEGGNPVYVPTDHTEEVLQIPTKRALEILNPLFQTKDICVIGQNIKYELLMLANYGIEIEGILEDTMIQSYLLDSESNSHGLDALAFELLGHSMIHYEDVAGKGKKQISFDQVPLKQALEYAAEDADATYEIHKLQRPKIKEMGLERLYAEMEMPLTKALAKVERNGVKINAEYLGKLSSEFGKDLVELEKDIYAEAGEEFKINSPKQLGAILFDKMGIPPVKKTKTGYSTDASVLEKLAQGTPIAQYILNYRAKAKLISTYLDPLPELIAEPTGRIHTSYNQTIAATGRLSSVHPNLQNIPIRGEDGNKVRAAFIPKEGHVLVSADYSQIELRLLAHFSQDPALIQAFQNDADIHRETAAAIYGVDPEEITGDGRRVAKAINFGIIYGMGAFRLAQEINVSNKEAKNFIDAYFKKYPGIRTYMDESVDFARKNLYVETLFKRRRPMRSINSDNHMQRTGAERVAVNTRIQGTAADIIKVAMLQVQEKLEKEEFQSFMIMQVHDELVFEAKEEEVGRLVPLVKETMEKVMENVPELEKAFEVPLVVECGVGKNWQEAH